MKMKLKNTEKQTQFMCSLGGDGPKYEFVSMDDEEYGEQQHRSNIKSEPLSYQRARVLCSYDAKDNTELNLIGNEVSHREY